MKQSLLFIFVLVIGSMTSKISAQNIDIPDVNFKNALIEYRVDTNGDGEIQESEALAVEELDVRNRRISNLTGIEHFKNLTYLDITNNSISHLDLSSLVELKYLTCTENYTLSNLDLTGLNNLLSLDIEWCNITYLDLSHVPNLTRLRAPDCGGLTSIDISHCPNLIDLNIAINPITELDLSHNSKIERLDCAVTQIKNLNLSNLKNLDVLLCEFNPELEVVYLKNGKQESVRSFFNCPNLKYICADDSEIEDIRQDAINHFDLPNVIINSFCSSTMAGAFYTMNVQARLDLDNNGCDESDMNYPNFKMLIANATDSGFAVSGADGNFSINLDAGSYTFTPMMDNSYFTVSPESATYTIPDTVSPAFCITPKRDFNDLAVSIIPVRAARPGFSDAQYKIVYKNQGTTIQSGTVTFNFDDDKMNVISSTPVADQSDFGLLTYHFSNLAPFESKSVLVTMRTNAPTDNPAVNVNDVLNFSANITAQTDQTPEDNTAVLYQTVIGSFDPNDKTCLEGDIITPDMVGKRVNYLIRFENTGTAPAENVVVTDYIDTTVFDVNSLLITDASHTCHTQISKGNKVQFIFSDIQLPFTEPDKHGYVAFSILLKGDLQIGDSIKNYADIYFDYNLPITTNEALSEVKNRVITSVQQKISDATLLVYPNPSKGSFSVELKSNKSAPVQISVIDIEGKIVFAKQFAAQHGLIPVQLDRLPKGTYLVQAQQEKDVISRKIVVQ